MFKIDNADGFLLDKIHQACQGEYYRLVDVETHTVYDYHDGTLTRLDCPCYAFWNRVRPCKNCISEKTVRTGKTTLKIDSAGSGIYLVGAVRVEIEGKLLSLETSWDISDNLVTQDNLPTGAHFVTDLIDKFHLTQQQDSYTQLFNKRYAERELKKAIQSVEAMPLSLVILDIDHFKDVNDAYGHAVGDEVIRSLACLMKTFAQEHNAIPCRIGGDEFALIFPASAEKKVSEIMHTLQNEFSSQPFKNEHGTFLVSVSFGVAEYSPDMTSWRDLLKAADKQLYRNKERIFPPTIQIADSCKKV